MARNHNLSLPEKAALRTALFAEQVSQGYQRDVFRRPAPAGAQDVADVTVFTPRIDSPLGRAVAVFTEPRGLHVVFRDEVFPLSRRYDGAYREMRREAFGRTSDIESLEVVEDTAYFYWTSAWANLVFETNLHGYDNQPWTGRLYKSTWNGMLSTRPHPYVVLRGGYVRNEVALVQGSRADAEAFAEAL